MPGPPPSPLLSAAQLATLAEHGRELSASVGDVLFRVGDARYPLIAILEGEAAILSASGQEIIRHGPSGFLGEMNLLSGQTVYLTAVVTQPMRYIAVDREVLRQLLFDDGPLGDVLLSAAPGYEFVDWGGSDHVGGGSHGSLHRSDSLGALLWCGTGPDSRVVKDQWSLRDIAPLVREHFGLASPA